MNSGILGIPQGGLNTVESDRVVVEDEQGNDREKVIRVEEVMDLSGDVKYIEGEAYRERSVDVDEWYLDPDTDSIKKRSATRKETDKTDFVAVTASDDHDGFVLVGSADGTFVFDLLMYQNAEVSQAALDLSDWLDARPDFSSESAGGPVVSDSANHVMVWGKEGGDSDVFDDDRYGGDLQRAADAGELNPLSGTYKYDGTPFRVFIAGSGYVALWEPTPDTEEFAEWLASEVLPYAHFDTDDESDDSGGESA